jgi:hypothetical protein
VDGWRSASIGLSGVGRKEEVARIPGMRSAAAKLAFLPEQNRRMQAGGTRIGGHVLGSIGGRRSNARTFVGSARAGGTRDRSVYRSATRRHYLLADGGVTATCVHDDDDSVPLQRRSCHRQHPTAPRTRAPCFAASTPVMAGGDPSRRRCLDVLAGSLSLGETAARANIPQIVTPLSHSAAYFDTNTLIQRNWLSSCDAAAASSSAVPRGTDPARRGDCDAPSAHRECCHAD